jgi:predicted nucleic acid-binding protein
MRLGAGECSAIAVAITRRYAIAIDDTCAIKTALREAEIKGIKLTILRTQDIMLALIRASILTVDEADHIKADWAENHRFRLKTRSFRDLL